MAIQKINLGTEPLGEGGDTYRSANTKINENFSNPDHAASRLIGVGQDKIPLPEDILSAVTQRAISSEAYGSDANNITNSGYYSAITGTANRAPAGNYSGILALKLGQNILQLSASTLTSTELWMRFIDTRKPQLGGWGSVYTSANTTKDSKTNLLLASGSELPENSAASRLVGTATGNLMQVGTNGIGSTNDTRTLPDHKTSMKRLVGTGLSAEFVTHDDLVRGIGSAINLVTYSKFNFNDGNAAGGQGRIILHNSGKLLSLQGVDSYGNLLAMYHTYTTGNTTKDSNGFLKAASPVVDLYDDHIELNGDAEEQGSITYEKLGTGNYLVKGSLGFAQEGWYIEMPKDANGNVLVAVSYEQLENNDISIKTYDYMLNKKGRIVPDTETPLDIPEGRCINLRLHEVEEELVEPVPEPVEEPIVGKAEESEVVEGKPSEEPSEELK